MKLSEIKGEQALDVLAEIIEPASEIIADEKFKAMMEKEDRNLLRIAKYLLKEQKKPIMHIMAVLDGEKPEDYKPSVLSLPVKLIELFNDEELIKLFQ